MVTPIKASDLALPVIHSNGTPKDRLIENLSAAYNAIREAEQLLKECAPNGRDYYPLGPDCYAEAYHQHAERQRALVRVADELEALSIAIDEGGAQAQEAS